MATQIERQHGGGVCCNSPGKVLLVGGYAVLEEYAGGAVIAATSRFFADIAVFEGLSLEDRHIANPTDEFAVVVQSPQFHSQWQYTLKTVRNSSSDEIQHAIFIPVNRDHANKYVECAVNCALTAILSSESGRQALRLTLKTFREATPEVAGAALAFRMLLRADNDFYSQRDTLHRLGKPVNSTELAALPAFCPPPRDCALHKTGLGSSAALVTAVSAATLAAFGHFHKKLDLGAFQRVTHDIAQIAHGLAQGKIGSGFDVCSAALGSVLYHRVPPAVLGKHMEAVEAYLTSVKTGSYEAENPVHWAVDETSLVLADWTYSVEPFGLPRGIDMMLADVAGGSETPGMVRNVLAWRDRAEMCKLDAHELAKRAITEDVGCSDAQIAAATSAASRSVGPLLWRVLCAANARVAAVLSELDALSVGEDYDVALNAACCMTTDQLKTAATSIGHPVEAKLFALSSALSRCRELLREMGELAGVPIEPESQTNLANASMSVPGVLTSGVPGAGGFDALYVVFVNAPAHPDSVRKQVEKVWLEWPGGALTPLLLRNGAALGAPGAGTQVSVV